MKTFSILTPALLLCTSAIAWPEFLQPGEILERGEQLLQRVRRDDSSTTSKYNLSLSANEGQVTSTSTTDTQASQTGSATSITGSQTGSATSGGSKVTQKATTTKHSQTVFGLNDPTGGISMITPNPLSPATYYKIKDYVTFGWNYTSCSILPSAVDILAVASQSTYTLALNQTVSASTQAFTWDTGNFQDQATNKLLSATYTLIVHDAAIDVSATPSPGYLGIARSFPFAMYSPQASVPFEGFKCVTCSAGVSSIEKQTMSVIFGMMAVTILSFTWFTGAAGLI